MATYAEKLASIETAISRIETGAQDVMLDGRRVTYGDLGAMYKERERLERLAAREARGGGIRVRLGTPVG
jgi:hypothetical protein